MTFVTIQCSRGLRYQDATKNPWTKVVTVPVNCATLTQPSTLTRTTQMVTLTWSTRSKLVVRTGTAEWGLVTRR